MHPLPTKSPKIVFGPFEFDSESGELRKHGFKIKLPSQPGQILGALVRRPGELVTREDLFSQLWPGASAGDFEHGLNAAVNKLRQALSDAANQPRYIETLVGRGYRFVAPVNPVGQTVLQLVPPSATPEAEPSRRGLPQWVLAVGALLAVVVGVAWITLHRWTDLPMKATRFVVAPPKGYYLEGGGVRQSFALSPDGARIAFTAKDTSGKFRLFLRDFSELEARPVADGEGAYSVVWTPDGQALLFTAHGKLRRIAVHGAVSQILSDQVLPYFSSAIPFGTDRLLVSNTQMSGVMPASGGTPQLIDRVYSWAQLLPGGRDFLYTLDDPKLGSLRARIAMTGSNDVGVEVVQADSRVQYTGSLHAEGGYLVYLRGGALLAHPFDLAGRRVTSEPRAIARRVPSFGFTGAADFSVSMRGMIAYQSYTNRSQFIWVDRTGKRLSAASPADISSSFARLSPDGRWLAAVPFDIERGVSEIWLYDAVTGAGRRTIFGPGIQHHPVWSPDSRRLVHIVANHTWPRLGLSSFDGTPENESFPDTGVAGPTDWSPDGRFILFNNSNLSAITGDFPSDVFAIDMFRKRRVVSLLSTRFSEYNAVFSPDGKWLAFLSTESGKEEIYMQALDRRNDSLSVTGERFLISRQGAQCLRWNKNGKELFYLGSDGRVYAVSIAVGSTGVRAGEPEPLFTIDPEARTTIHAVASFDVSADGNRFVIPSITPGDSSVLVVLQDWESLVAKP